MKKNVATVSGSLRMCCLQLSCLESRETVCFLLILALVIREHLVVMQSTLVMKSAAVAVTKRSEVRIMLKQDISTKYRSTRDKLTLPFFVPSF